MKGFEVYVNGEVTKVPVHDDGLTLIDIFHKDDDSRIHIERIDYTECQRIVWHDYSPINIGDRFEIKVTEIDEPSTSAKTIMDKNIKRPITKLEYFRILETELKEQGLI
jgi:hypothetical protein